MIRRAALILYVTIGAAAAQPTSAPEPIVRVGIDPPSVTVGQPATLHIDVLAPNYMTKPPVVPDIQFANAVTRASGTVNLSEQRDGVAFAGVRFEFMIFPQEAGAYAIDGRSITLTYAADPPATREATVATPRISFEATVPDAAHGLDPFVAASRLEAKQDVRRSSDALKVGDAVTRTVTIEAEGTPAMLLPPTRFAPVEGATLYPAQPELQDRIDQRSGALSATRVDQATYMLTRPGELTLPAVEIAWWNTARQAVEQARADAVTLTVAANPATPVAEPQAATRTWRDTLLRLTDRWPLLAAVAAALIALVWLLPSIIRAISRRAARRRAAYRASEACAYAALRSAARRGDAGETYSALLTWLMKFEPAAPERTIRAFRKAAGDAALDDEIAQIEDHLFARRGESASPRRLVKRVAVARRRLLREATYVQPAHALPRDVNPRAANAVAGPARRPVAR